MAGPCFPADVGARERGSFVPAAAVKPLSLAPVSGSACNSSMGGGVGEGVTCDLAFRASISGSEATVSQDEATRPEPVEPNRALPREDFDGNVTAPVPPPARNATTEARQGAPIAARPTVTESSRFRHTRHGPVPKTVKQGCHGQRNQEGST